MLHGADAGPGDSGLRRRVAAEPQPQEVPSASFLETAVEAATGDSQRFRSLAKIDVFRKHREEYARRQSPLGAALSTAALSLIVTLLLYELLSYALGWEAYRTELSVDVSSGPHTKVPVYFDITFPSIGCNKIALDAIDATGTEEYDVTHDLYKSPVDAHGQLLFLGKYNYVERRLGANGAPRDSDEHDERRDPRSPKFCGSCYIEPTRHHHGWDRKGGPMDVHAHKAHATQCCNTCESVMQFYAAHRLPQPHAFEIEQCIDEMSEANPGCNVRGTLEMNKVRGNFHFLPPTDATPGAFGMHVRSFALDDILRFNVSHRINEFVIGDRTVKRFGKHGVHYPLNQAWYTVEEGLGIFKYYVQVVSVSYESGAPAYDSDGLAQLPPSAYDYSVQAHHQEFNLAGTFGANRIPGLFFVFDFHPTQVHNVFERPPFSRFLVKACSIVGGVFVVLGLVDRIVEAIHRRFVLPGVV